MSSDRKRSRWGGPPPSRSNGLAPAGAQAGASREPQRQLPERPAAPATTTVSDQDALAALLSSAEARQKEREAELPRKHARRGEDGSAGSRHNDEQRRDYADGGNRRRGRGDRASSNSDNDNNNRGRTGSRSNVVPDDDKNYYGPAGGSRNRPPDHKNSSAKDTGSSDAAADDDDDHGEPKQKPNFGLSGALAKDDDKGNMYKGVVLKFSEPPEARAPNTQWRLYVFKGEEALETLHISKQSAYLFGRNTDISDIPLLHGSCSSQHAVLQYRALPNVETGKRQCSPYIMDLESTNGTFLNSVRIDAARYYQLKKGDVLKFGASTREYVLLTAHTTTI